MAAGDVEAAERALAGLPAGTSGQAAVAHGMVAWYRGDAEEAARRADEAQELADGTGEDLAFLTDLRAMVAHTSGRWEAHTELRAARRSGTCPSSPARCSTRTSA